MLEPASEDVTRSNDDGDGLRLVIADDQPRSKQSLRALLTALRWDTSTQARFSIQIVGEADSGQQAVEQVQALLPDVIVMDLPTHDSTSRLSTSESKMDGLEAIRTIKSRWPAIRVVVLTLFATDRSAVLMAGADVFLLKGCPVSELLAAVSSAEV